MVSYLVIALQNQVSIQLWPEVQLEHHSVHIGFGGSVPGCSGYGRQ